MECQSDRRRRVPIYTRWRIKLRVMTTIALLLCTELHPEPLRSLYSGTTIPGGRGLFPDLVGHFFLGSPTEFRIRRKHLLNTLGG